MGKTVEQALLEVMEEEELASLRAQQVSTLLFSQVDQSGLVVRSIKLASPPDSSHSAAKA